MGKKKKDEEGRGRVGGGVSEAREEEMWSGRGKWWSGGERVDASHGAWSQLVTMASVPRAAFSRSLSGVSFFLLFILPLTLFFSFLSFVDLCILSFLPIPFLSLFFLLLILLFFFLTFLFPF